MMTRTEVKAIAILFQTTKPRKSSDELNYQEALHRWRKARALFLGRFIPEVYKKLFEDECPKVTEPNINPNLGRPKAQKAVTLIRPAGYDPTERPMGLDLIDDDEDEESDSEAEADTLCGV